MNLAQKYAYTVYREESFSKAAKKLFISQPALSEMIKRLESELGFLIFNRSQTPLKLTLQGRIYMEYLEDAFEKERIMLKRVRSASGEPKTELILGGESFLSNTILPLACGTFLKAFNDVYIKLDLADSESYESTTDKIENDQLNIAIKYSYDTKRSVGIPLLEEQFFLALTRDCPGAKFLEPYAVDIDCVLKEENFTVDKSLYDTVPEGLRIFLRDLYICNPELESYIKKIPYLDFRVINSRNRRVFYDLMLTGIGSILVTDMIASIERHRSRNVLFVPIDSKRTLYAVHKKGKKLSNEEKAFLSILSDICSQPKSNLF